MIDKILDLVNGKNVFIATHWDADGITSGAMLYHSLKNHAKSIRTLSKGKVFRIEDSDIPEDADIVICADVQPSNSIKQGVIYVDHHPYEENVKGLKSEFIFKAYDTGYQSSSYLLWDQVLKQTGEPYMVFLALLGFFGDAGKNDEIPIELEVKALDSFPELMEPCYWPDGRMCLKIETLVSSINVGKRMHWQGTVPMELLKSINSYEDFVNKNHPLFREIDNYKRILGQLYRMPVKIEDLGTIDFIKISCPHNVQGVLCARHMNEKPILTVNHYDRDNVMGSMRVPEKIDFDAGAFLQSFMGRVDGLLGGGHEKAGGMSFPANELENFYNALKETTSVQAENEYFK